MDAQPQLFILSGPNGAGKTTTARDLLPRTLGLKQFVNADNIAEGLSPFAPETTAFQAGRLMLRRIEELLMAKENFAFETTLAGHRTPRFFSVPRLRATSSTLSTFGCPVRSWPYGALLIASGKGGILFLRRTFGGATLVD